MARARTGRPSDWMDHLPLVLLGLRSATRDNSAISPAHLLYGTPLRLPGEFFPPAGGMGSVPTSEFVSQLQRDIRDMTPFPAEFHSAGTGRSPVPTSLWSTPAVFVRLDVVKRPLTPPYTGPFEVLERNHKTFVLSRSGKPWTVSVDRLKPCLTHNMSCLLYTSPSPRDS